MEGGRGSGVVLAEAAESPPSLEAQTWLPMFTSTRTGFGNTPTLEIVRAN